MLPVQSFYIVSKYISNYIAIQNLTTLLAAMVTLILFISLLAYMVAILFLIWLLAL